MDFHTIVEKDQTTIRTTLLSCSLEEAPERYDESCTFTPLPHPNLNHAINKISPLAGVEEVGQGIIGDLSGVDMSGFETSDEGLTKLDYQIEVVLGDRLGTILFKMKVGEKDLGYAKIAFSES